MKIGKNLRCKDFTYHCRPAGSRLAGYENYWVWDVYCSLNGKLYHTASTKKEAQRWVSKKVKEVNAVLEAARKKYGED